MQPVLIYRTPLWKEAATLLFACAFIALGVGCVYGSYITGEWWGYIYGFPSLILGFYSGILGLSSNVVLRLTAEGVFVQPNHFSKRTVPWSNIERFEKSVQTFSQSDRFGSSEHKAAYLGIILKQPHEAGAAFSIAQSVLAQIDPKNAKDPLIGRQQQGHIFIGELYLPGKVDTVLEEVRAYHTQVTGGLVRYGPEEVLPSTKGSFRPSVYSIILFTVGCMLGLLIIATMVTGMNVEQLLKAIFKN